MSAALQTVHVRVNDAATGEPTPCRIRFTGPKGEYYAPFGHPTEFAMGENEDVGGNLMTYYGPAAYIDGTCEIRLPEGPLSVVIHKGPEYTPLLHEFTLGKGQRTLRYTLERWIDLRQRGWYAGDTRAHCLTPHAALLEAAAEDLAVVNLLAYATRLPTWGLEEVASNPGCDYENPPLRPVMPNILAFSGQRPLLEIPGHMVVVNTHNVSPRMGSVGLLNCHRAVYPLRIELEEETKSWTVADWCDQCHRKGGLVVWTDLPDGPPEEAPYGEALADLILGKIDAVESSMGIPEEEWYALLDSGFRIPLVGGSGKMDNECPLGFTRTYARLQAGEALTYQNWIEAVRAGRTFVTNHGTFLLLTVNDQDPGAVVDVPSAAPRVRLRAEACGRLPFHQLEVLLNGQRVAAVEAAGSPCAATVDTEVTLPEPGWLTARCRDNRWRLPSDKEYVTVAQTSPVHVQWDGQPTPAKPGTVRRLLKSLRELESWVQHLGGQGNGDSPKRLLDILRAACETLAQRLVT